MPEVIKAFGGYPSELAGAAISVRGNVDFKTKLIYQLPPALYRTHSFKGKNLTNKSVTADTEKKSKGTSST